MQMEETKRIMAGNSRGNTATGRAQKSKGRSKNKMIIFAIEIFLILIMLAVLFLVMTTGSRGPKVVELNPDNLGINEGVLAGKNQGTGDAAVTPGVIAQGGYMNIALFGVDATTANQLYKGSRSDCTMIASINMDTGDIKLVSVYRDTYLNLGTDTYNKCNHAYSNGGAEQAIKMLNMNLDMDITNFITVNYKSLMDLIDGLGGIYIDVDKNELRDINNYQISIICEQTKHTETDKYGQYTYVPGEKDGYIPVRETGYQKLNGLQAAAYCRIRKSLAGGDFDRAANQREVVKAIEEQAKKTDLATLTKVFNTVIEEVYTSLNSDDLLSLISNINNYRIVEEGGFPEASMVTTANIGAKGSVVIPLDLESNVSWLHEFLFEDEDYAVSDTVKECGAKIKTDTSKYLHQ